MTTIGSVTISVPASYGRSGYDVQLRGSMSSSTLFNQLRELFAKAEYGTAIHKIPGSRPYGEDLTDELANTQHVDFTDGTTGKAQDGYYLLQPSYIYSDDESPEGHSYVFTINLFFLGTLAYYSHAYRVKILDELESDWDI